MPSIERHLHTLAGVDSPARTKGSFKLRLAGLSAAVITAMGLIASVASAGDGSSFDVSTSASVDGSSVSGVLTVTSQESGPITLSALTVSLEVRFDEGVAIPLLPAGSDAGFYRVAQVTLPAPVTLVAGGSRSFPFVIDPCGATVAPYRNARDMRAYASVSGGRVRDGYSDGFPLPAPCPTCGNGIREGGEQCDAGPNGGGCCGATCQFRANGTLCRDANACTQADVCQAGVCTGGDPIVCTATDPCRDAGTCNPATGTCSQPAKPNGSACDDRNACTQVDACQSGTCRGGSAVICSASGTCTTASCDPTTGACGETPKADGTACSDADACTSADRCVAGVCASGDPLVCDDFMSCTADRCDAATGCSFSSAGATCEACDAAQCSDCSARCDTVNQNCVTACWEGFSSCLAGCTSTYCAPFCQVDLGRCLESCPTTVACQSACESGNGCGTGCSGVAATGAGPQVPSFSGLGFVVLAALMVLIGGFEVLRIGRRKEG
jgi:hypothetical protein